MSEPKTDPRAMAAARDWYFGDYRTDMAHMLKTHALQQPSEVVAAFQHHAPLVEAARTMLLCFGKDGDSETAEWWSEASDAYLESQVTSEDVRDLVRDALRGALEGK